MNLSKSVDVFDPATLTGTQVLLIGLGATGSFVAMNLVKMGVEDIIFFDYDVVEEKNVNNQLYSLNHVGMPKTQAMHQILSSFNPAIKAEQFINEKFDMSKHKRYFSKRTVVYLLVDHNRQALLADLFKNPNVHYLIETRIGVDVFDIFNILEMIVSVKFKLISGEKTVIIEDSATVGAALSQHMPEIANAGTHLPFVDGRQVDTSATIASLTNNGQPVTITLTKQVQGN